MAEQTAYQAAVFPEGIAPDTVCVSVTISEKPLSADVANGVTLSADGASIDELRDADFLAQILIALGAQVLGVLKKGDH